MGESRGEPHAIFNPLGWMASGGRSLLFARANKVVRVQTCVVNDDLSQCKLDLDARNREIAGLKGQLKDLALQNKALDLSRTDKIAKGLAEPNVKLCDDHFEIPLPLKADIELPNNLALPTSLRLQRSNHYDSSTQPSGLRFCVRVVAAIG